MIFVLISKVTKAFIYGGDDCTGYEFLRCHVDAKRFTILRLVKVKQQSNNQSHALTELYYYNVLKVVLITK